MVGRDDIVRAVWPDAVEGGVSEQSIDALVRRLRERLAEAATRSTSTSSPCAGTGSGSRTGRRSIVTSPLALYLHIPFCAVRCHYCDFNTYAGLDGCSSRTPPRSARRSGRRAQSAARPPVRTIFLGGGTPTVLPADLLAGILEACRESFDIEPDAEITSEANPGTTDAERFRRLASRWASTG